MPKYEYEVLIKYYETHSVFVEADDWEEAEKIALEKYSNGETEIKYSYTDAEVNWSNEEDAAANREYEEN